VFLLFFKGHIGKFFLKLRWQNYTLSSTNKAICVFIPQFLVALFSKCE
jgi:hypothetical protein